MINNEVMGMEHLAFRINDLDEGLKFFNKILGFKVNFRFQYDGLRIAILEAEKAKIEIWEDRNPEGACAQGNCPGAENNEVAVSVERMKQCAYTV
ncbi:MAG: VOC family protein [Caulobacteraceae bacterium]